MSPLEEKAPQTKRPFQVAPAAKESRPSLAGRAFTYINREVQLDLGVLAGLLMYGLFTVIQHSTNRTPIKDMGDRIVIMSNRIKDMGHHTPT